MTSFVEHSDTYDIWSVRDRLMRSDGVGGWYIPVTASGVRTSQKVLQDAIQDSRKLHFAIDDWTCNAESAVTSILQATQDRDIQITIGWAANKLDKIMAAVSYAIQNSKRNIFVDVTICEKVDINFESYPEQIEMRFRPNTCYESTLVADLRTRWRSFSGKI